MRISKRFKKIASLVLSLAMVVTLLPTQYAYAAGNGSDGQPAVVSDDDAEANEVKKLVYFSFDDSYTEGTSEIVSASDGAAVTATKNGDNASISEDSKVGNGALSLTGGTCLTINDSGELLAGKSKLTVSYWGKGSASTAKEGWAWFASKNDGNPSYNNENYIGALDGGGSINAERYLNGRNSEGSGAVACSGDDKNAWKYVTIVLDTNSSTLYVNGQQRDHKDNLAALTSIITNTSKLHIGKANWGGGEYYKGLIDEFTVYDGALTPSQVASEYLEAASDADKAAYFTAVGTELDNLMAKNDLTYVKEDISLPTQVYGSAIEWSSSAADKIATDGTVGTKDGSDVTLTAKVTYGGEEKINKPYAATMGTTVTIEYKDSDNQDVKDPKMVLYKKADSYTYEVEETEKVITSGAKAYILAEEQTLEVAHSASPKITLQYEEDSIKGVEEAPAGVTTRIGVQPELPKMVKASFTSGISRDVEVVWNLTADDYAAATGEEPKIINGVFKDTEIEVTIALTVKNKNDYLMAHYAFDETDAEAGWADSKSKKGKATKVNTVNVVDGLKGKAVELPGGGTGKGAVKLPVDLLIADGQVQNDFTISMFIKVADKKQHTTALMLHGNVINGKWSQDTATRDHISLVNRRSDRENEDGLWVEYTSFDKEGTAEDAIGGSSGKSNTLGGKNIAPTTANKWEHIAIVTKGSTGEAWLYKNGECVASLSDMTVKASDLKGRLNYLGCTDWPDPDYAGAFDEFKVYNTVLEESEIKSLCDEMLYTEQLNKTKDALAIKNEDGTSYDEKNVTGNLILPTEAKGYSATITSWASSNPDVVSIVSDAGTTKGRVTRPSDGAPDAEVTLTATIQIEGYAPVQVPFKITVKAMEGVNVKPLKDAIADAEQTLENAEKRDIYTEASLKALQNAITAANGTLNEEGLNTAGVAAAVEKLNAAVDKGFELKDYNALQKNLVAWYPLDKKSQVNDKSGKGNHGKVNGKITFNNADGAIFPGTATLQDYISLPDTLAMTEQTTFSFWMKRGEDTRNMLGFGSIFGERGSDAKHFHMTSVLYTSISNNGWNAHEGVTTDVDAKWHHVTIVFDGNKYTVYVDGAKEVGKTTTISLSDAWNAKGGKKYAYIGNCAYGANKTDGDKDFVGSIKDFRIYNVAMEEAQVQQVQAYIDKDEVAWNYAKEELIDAMDARQNTNGTITRNIHDGTVDTNSKITLPKTSYGNAVVTWASSNNEIINVAGMDADNKVSVNLPPAENDPEDVTLTATITMTGKNPETATMEFKCTVFTRAGNVSTQELETVIAQAEALAPNEAKYTAGSWSALQAALDEAHTRKENPRTQNLVDKAKEDLEKAIAGLVDKSELDSKIAALEAQIRELNKAEYTTASLTELNNKLKAAKDVANNPDATQDEIDDAKDEFPVMSDVLVARGSKTELNKLVASAKKLEEEDYSAETWGAFAAKLEEVDRIGTDLSQEQINGYYNALKTAMDALVPSAAQTPDQTEKDAFSALVQQAGELTADDYTQATWDAYQAKLEDAQRVAAKTNATRKEIAAAEAALKTAEEGLVIRAEKAADADDKAGLQALIDAAEDLTEADYSTETWTEYKTAVQKAEAVVAKTKLTKSEVNKAKTDLAAARKALRPSAAQTPDQADKDTLSQAITDEGGLTESDYTTASWVTYTDALANAEALLEDPSATKKEMAAAKTALENAAKALELEEGKAPSDAENAALAAAIGEGLEETDYTTATWEAYAAALAKAQKVAAKTNASATEVKAATTALKNAAKALELAEGKAPSDAEKAALTEALQDAQNLVKDHYTEESWTAFETALAKAQKVADKDNASKDMVTAATTALEEAVKALVPTDEQKTTAEDKASVNADIEAAKALKEADYTPESWEAYQAAIANIEKVMAKENLTKAELAKAGTDLKAAKELLKPAGTETKVDKVTLNKTTLTLAVKKTETLTATISPSNATNQTKQWKSSNDKVAKVDQNGMVTAVEKGTADITVTVDGKSATCKVTVIVPVTNVKIVDSLGGGTKPAVAAGKKITLKANITPSNASDMSVTWSVDTKSKKYASIDKKGVLSTKKTGAGKTVTVTAISNDAGKKKATITVKIMKNAVTKITLKAGKKTVKAGKKITVKATVKTNGKKASKTLAWSIDKKSAKYASINSKGQLSTKKTGKGKTVTVTATATDGTKKKATIKIKITK